jgi:dGTPase
MNESDLKPYAVRSEESRGRRHEEVRAEMDADVPRRLCFQKDRDRIIHCKAFRRLKDKTQVFVPHHDDHARNRLTHTLEVAQIARDLARMLGLNEDLAEAIALAHDLGHTPFGHAGEWALDKCLRFEHNEQSQRIVEEIEHVHPGFPGLNLSVEVIEGLMKHQTSWDRAGVKGNSGGGTSGDVNSSCEIRPSLEAQVVNLADEIAYQNHDVDDGLRNGFFTEEKLAGLVLWRAASEKVQARYGELEDEYVRRARTVSSMIGIMISDVYLETLRRLEVEGVKTLKDVYACEKQLVGFSSDMEVTNRDLKQFLARNVYFSEVVRQNSRRGQEIIKALFHYYVEGPEGFPKKPDGLMDPEEARDFIAGMTDRFAEQKAVELGLEF